MQKLVWQNANGIELDLTSGNYGITEWEGFSNTSLNIQSQQVPFQDGGVFLDALMEQRELNITLAIQDNNNLELRYQQRRELISALNPKLGEGYLIYTNDYISKRIKCIPQIPLFETHNSDMAGTPKASLSWTACEPYWEDLEDTVETITGTNGKIVIENEGDVKIGFVLDIMATNNEINNINIMKEGEPNNILIVKDFMNCRIDTNTGRKQITSLGYSAQQIETCVCSNYSGTGTFYAEYVIYCKWANKYIASNANTNYLYESTDGINWTETNLVKKGKWGKAFVDTVNNQIITFDYGDIPPKYYILNTSLTEWTEIENTNNYRSAYIDYKTNTLVFSTADYSIMSKATNVLMEFSSNIVFTLPNGETKTYAKPQILNGTIEGLLDYYDGTFMIAGWYSPSVRIDIEGVFSQIDMYWTHQVINDFDNSGLYFAWGSQYMSSQTQIWVCDKSLQWKRITLFSEIITGLTNNIIFSFNGKAYLGVEYNKNIIANSNGNIAISLDVGRNTINLLADKNCTMTLKYRQKYIGV